MSVVWKKVWRDVWARKGRTVQVVLSIGVGVFAIGLTVGMRDVVKGEVTRVSQSTNPAHIYLGLGEGVNRDVVRALGRLPGIEDAEGVASIGIQWKLLPEDEWRDAAIIARDDYVAQKYNTVTLIEGNWPGRGGVVVERSSAQGLDIPYPGTLYFEVNERPKAMPVVGVAYDFMVDSPSFGGDATFYVSRRDMEKLGGPVGFTQIKAVLPDYDEELAKAAGVAMTERLEEQDIGHGTPETVNPDEIFDAGDGIFFLLIVMAVLTMGLSLFLVINTITAIVVEQVPQIGVMKAVGARSRQIFRIYLTGVVVYIAIALLIAIPLGAIGAFQLSVWLLGLFSMEVEGFIVSPLAVSLQLALGLLSPLIAALWPVTSGARTTVREAIRSYGLSVGVGLIDRVLSHFRRLPPLVALTVGNTFRKKGRLAMTLVSLVGGGAIFMMVMGVQASMVNTFDKFLETYNFDIIAEFEQPQRIRLHRGAGRCLPRYRVRRNAPVQRGRSTQGR